MNEHKRKATRTRIGRSCLGRTCLGRTCLGRTWRDDIAGDVFELWIGISRLMAKVREPDRARDLDTRKRPPVKRTAAGRRLPRRKAA